MTANIESLETPSQSDSRRPGFLVVGLGASAGGISALKQFFSHVTADLEMAFVVIQHLSPQHESNLAAVLQTQTRVPVIQVNETLKLEPNHIYVVPPNKYLKIDDGDVKLTEPERLHGAHTSIDLFFRTLAEAYGKDAVGIVMSGTGADGTLGLGRIKERGGFAIIQDPAEAEYHAMPRSAIDKGLYDLILPAGEMPDRLQALSTGTRRPELPVTDDDDETPKLEDPAEVREILALLRQRSGHDFSQYKRPTLLRRITHRVQVHQLPNIASYVTFLRQHSDEIPLLLRDLLITVTNFFRDREAFEVLEREVVPKLFAGKTVRDEVRIWVVGCATGEEAYSIAILLSEYAQRLADPPNIQIFATDINERAIAEARQTRYPRSISVDVSTERLLHFFIQDGDHYRINKDIRERILFAPHNVLRDPPFSRLDLISCRNLLIYLKRELQERLLATFHFALVPNGYLFLGAAESAEQSPLFDSVVKKHRIYIRRTIAPSIQTTRAAANVEEWSVKPSELPGLAIAKGTSLGELHHRIVERLAAPSVLIDEDYNIVHLSEHVGRYLRFVGGEPSRNLLDAVHPAMRLDLCAMLLAAKARSGDSPQAAETRRLRLEIDGKACVVGVTVRLVVDSPVKARGFFLVIFDEIIRFSAASNGQSARDASELKAVEQLEEELKRTRDQLHITVEQYETSAKESKASNEELQAINEELRSTTEELETSKEELQSLNEELTTVNQELREKIDELGRVNSDLHNLIGSTDIGTIFLDRGLQIKLYTARAQELFNITLADVGRPLEHFTHRLDYRTLTEDAQAVLRNLQTKEREVHASNGRWYLARMLPYRTIQDKIDGVVLNFVDITEHRRAEELRRETAMLQERSQILDLANVFVRDIDDRVIVWNAGCERLYGYTKEEALGHSSHQLLATEFKQPLPEIMAQLFETGAWQGELSHATRAGERITVASRWVLHRNDANEPSAILEVNQDVTALKHAEEELRQADRRKNQFLATLAHELRNPLAVTLSSLELLSLADGDQEAIQVARVAMHRQFEHLMRLVDDLLDLERLGRGKITLRTERIALSGVVDASLETSRPLLGTYGHTLDVSVPDRAIYVVGDQVRLSQALTNVLNNAAKYTPADGRIRLDVAVDDRQAVICVRDTGIGISAEILPHIFDYFVQEAPGSEVNRRGLGVGLALAHQLIELHGGTIEARSDGRGKGSEFTIRLPLVIDQSEDSAPVRPIATGELASIGTVHKILIIDDEHDVADLLASLLRRAGHQVWTAYSGATGVETAQKCGPDVALIDLSMPDMDGYEVARQLRERIPQTLLIALSGLVNASDHERSLAAGFDYHVAKPATLRQIEVLCAKPRRQSPSAGK